MLSLKSYFSYRIIFKLLYYTVSIYSGSDSHLGQLIALKKNHNNNTNYNS